MPKCTDAVGPEQATAEKPRIEKVNSYLSTVSTSLAILGGIGTVAVWLAANFYTGEVEIQAPEAVQAVAVKVSDSKGQSTTYYSRKISLMPGTYHLEVSADGGRPFHTDAAVKFNEKTTISLESQNKQSASSASRRWWKFWKKAAH